MIIFTFDKLQALNAEGGPSGIPQNESLTRSLHLLDHMLVSNTHKIGKQK